MQAFSQQVYLSVVWVDVVVEWVFDRIIIIVRALCDSSYARMVLNGKKKPTKLYPVIPSYIQSCGCYITY